MSMYIYIYTHNVYDSIVNTRNRQVVKSGSGLGDDRLAGGMANETQQT